MLGGSSNRPDVDAARAGRAQGLRPRVLHLASDALRCRAPGARRRGAAAARRRVVDVAGRRWTWRGRRAAAGDRASLSPAQAREAVAAAVEQTLDRSVALRRRATTTWRSPARSRSPAPACRSPALGAGLRCGDRGDRARDQPDRDRRAGHAPVHRRRRRRRAAASPRASTRARIQRVGSTLAAVRRPLARRGARGRGLDPLRPHAAASTCSSASTATWDPKLPADRAGALALAPTVCC